MKICADCGVEKPLSEFNKKGKSKRTQEIWYEKRCKKCHNLKFRPATGMPNPGNFQPGHVTWNKGTKGIMQPNKTTFKLGQIPWNKSINFDGNCRECINSKQWRKFILERDIYKCKQCSSTHRLHVHHIKNWKEYPELRFDINNGITLCNSCHSKLHRKIDGFPKSEIPWNKNTIGIMKPNKTSFKKGSIPWNKKLKLGVNDGNN